MNNWWEALSTMKQVMYCIAVPSTLLLIIQTVMVIVGFGDGGPDVNPSDTSGLDLDVPDGDVEFDLDAPDGDLGGDVSGDIGALKLFTFQGIIAFATTFSWTTLVCLNGLPNGAAIVIGIMAGIAMMYVVAKLMQFSKKLTENGTFHAKSVIGEDAQVYIPILPNGRTGGKVTVNNASRFAELEAVTESGEMIPSGERVRIVDVRGDVVVVERV